MQSLWLRESVLLASVKACAVEGDSNNLTYLQVYVSATCDLERLVVYKDATLISIHLPCLSSRQIWRDGVDGCLLSAILHVC